MLMNYMELNYCVKDMHIMEFISTWIETFSELPPDEFMNTLYNNSRNSLIDFVGIAVKFIRKTKSKPDQRLISNIILHSECISEEFIIAWIETFSELPPDEIMNILYNCCCYICILVNFIDIATAFIRKTKTRPDPRLMSNIISQSAYISEEFIIVWIETFSELPPDEFMHWIYNFNINYIDYVSIGRSFIQSTKTKPSTELMNHIKTKILGDETYDNKTFLLSFLINWIEIFSEYPAEFGFHNSLISLDLCRTYISKLKQFPYQFMSVIDPTSASHKFMILYMWVHETHERIPNDVNVAKIVEYANQNDEYLNKLYEIYMKIFVELPPDYILKKASRNLILEENVSLKQELRKLKTVSNA